MRVRVVQEGVSTQAVQEARHHQSQKWGRDGNTNTSTATKRALMPHHNATHIQNTGLGLKRQRVDGMEGDRHMGDEVRQ